MGLSKNVGRPHQVFLDYLHSKVPTAPFSALPLSPESLTILSQLERLTVKGWWTVGSQPAVNGVSSSDPVFGWGPKAGHVFQKCFVEFFCNEEDVDAIEKRVELNGGGWVHYFACNNEVSFPCSTIQISLSNCLSGRAPHKCPRWRYKCSHLGIFPAKEIVQTTIIERESFLSWKVLVRFDIV